MAAKGVADHPEFDLMRELWEQGMRATEIAEELRERGADPVKVSTLARYGQRYWTNNTLQFTVDGDIDGLEDELRAAQSFGRVTKVNVVKKRYPGWEKIDGQNVQVDKESLSHTIEVQPEMPEPAFEVPIAPFSITTSRKSRQTKPAGFNAGFSFPDSQMGYFRTADGTLLPIHDESAINVAMQILAEVERDEGIDLIVNQGDDLDFAEFSTHRSTPGYKGVLKQNLTRHASHLSAQRTAAPDAEIVQLQGNHEARLEKFIIDKAPELLGLQRVGDSEPILSVPHLCKYDEMGITVSDPYPQGVYWANDYLKFHHGTVSSGVPGGAAGKSLKAEPGISVIYGHDHYQAVARDRVRTATGMRNVFAASAGCLCRLDGLVPSATGAVRPSGKMLAAERWQQGILVFYYEPEGLQRCFVEPVLIEDGVALFRGKLYQSTVDVNGEPI